MKDPNKITEIQRDFLYKLTEQFGYNWFFAKEAHKMFLEDPHLNKGNYRHYISSRYLQRLRKVNILKWNGQRNINSKYKIIEGAQFIVIEKKKNINEQEFVEKIKHHFGNREFRFKEILPPFSAFQNKGHIYKILRILKEKGIISMEYTSQGFPLYKLNLEQQKEEQQKKAEEEGVKAFLNDLKNKDIHLQLHLFIKPAKEITSADLDKLRHYKRQIIKKLVDKPDITKLIRFPDLKEVFTPKGIQFLFNTIKDKRRIERGAAKLLLKKNELIDHLTECGNKRQLLAQENQALKEKLFQLQKDIVSYERYKEGYEQLQDKFKEIMTPIPVPK